MLRFLLWLAAAAVAGVAVWFGFTYGADFFSKYIAVWFPN